MSTVRPVGLITAQWFVIRLTGPVVQYMQLNGLRCIQILEVFLRGERPARCRPEAGFPVLTLKRL
jgi:hypothetical protein